MVGDSPLTFNWEKQYETASDIVSHHSKAKKKREPRASVTASETCFAPQRCAKLVADSVYGNTRSHSHGPRI